MLNDTTIAALLETAGALAKIASTLAQLAADAGRQALSTATPVRTRRLPPVEPQPQPTPPIRVRPLPTPPVRIRIRGPVIAAKPTPTPPAPVPAERSKRNLGKIAFCTKRVAELTGLRRVRQCNLTHEHLAEYAKAMRTATTPEQALAAYRLAGSRHIPIAA